MTDDREILDALRRLLALYDNLTGMVDECEGGALSLREVSDACEDPQYARDAIAKASGGEA